ncbi:hypothetical protein A4A49_62845 [Nicotiana attenuata]|uniref:Uncharacterized protein n=1 Tax=Nicotiana attenuata TaxID=49451 RepID=A0A1J6JGA3_NICAT|nr:hypothetical protein A4A49_62845 [Nicotiana attenuata]
MSREGLPFRKSWEAFYLISDLHSFRIHCKSRNSISVLFTSLQANPSLPMILQLFSRNWKVNLSKLNLAWIHSVHFWLSRTIQRSVSYFSPCTRSN